MTPLILLALVIFSTPLALMVIPLCKASILAKPTKHIYYAIPAVITCFILFFGQILILDGATLLGPPRHMYFRPVTNSDLLSDAFKDFGPMCFYLTATYAYFFFAVIKNYHTTFESHLLRNIVAITILLLLPSIQLACYALIKGNLSPLLFIGLPGFILPGFLILTSISSKAPNPSFNPDAASASQRPILPRRFGSAG